MKNKRKLYSLILAFTLVTATSVIVPLSIVLSNKDSKINNDGNNNDDDENIVENPDNTNPPSDEPNEIINGGIWDGYSKSLMEFSQKNSFRVKTEYQNPENTNKKYYTNGTAWSFYINQTNDQVEWYLLTNYHVLSKAIEYNRKINIENNTNQEDNQYVTKLNNGLYLYDSYLNDENQQVYREVINKKDFKIDVNNDQDFEIYLISDYFPNQNNVVNENDYLDLFSKSSLNYNDSYNLDIAMIKIVMDQSLWTNSYDEFFSYISNPYKNYLELNTSQLDTLKYSNQKDVYICGNPITYFDGLYPQYIEKNNKYEQITYSRFDLSGIGYSFNGYINFPHNYIDEFKIHPGASGSATYQISSKTETTFDDMFNNIPVGIYSLIYNTNEYDDNGVPIKNWPGFIPFISDNFNLFENFKSFLNSSL